MAFNTAAFALFFPIVLLVYYLLPRRLQNAWLLFASGYFYFVALPNYLVYITCTAALAYVAGWVIEKQRGTRAGKAVLAAALVVVFGALIVFKYYGFFVSSIAGLLARAGVIWTPASLGLLEPLGISFYTFTTAGYLIDVARGDSKAERNPIDFALFVSFFPQLLSGPIARSTRLLPQLKAPRRFVWADIAAGGERFVFGLMKKAVVADWLLAYNDAILYRMHDQNALSILVAVLLYSMQLYFDFSGYCDMALGCARMLGLRLDENFRAPYFATSFASLWSRWHISLTSWFRDYLYIPLGGNRKGFVRKLINIAIIFLVSGLWHGAEWGYVVWGLVHGGLRIAEVIWRRVYKKSGGPDTGVVRWIKSAALYVVWSLSFVFFRVVNISDSVYAIQRCFAFRDYSLRTMLSRGMAILQANIASSRGYVLAVVAVIGIGLLFTLVMEYRKIYRAGKDEPDAGYVLRGLCPTARFVIVLLMVLAILFCGRFGVSSFVYFNY